MCAAVEVEALRKVKPMPTIASSELPVPKSWDEFEDICADLFGLIWNDPNVVRYGRMGQRQHGVDIRGQLPGGGIAGVQCKRKRQWPVSELTTNDIDDEVSEALSFEPSLSKFEALAHKFDHAIEAECQQHKAPRGHAGPNRNNSFDGHPGDGEPFQPEGLTRIRASRSSRGGRTNGGGAQHSVIRKIYPTLGGGCQRPICWNALRRELPFSAVRR